MHSAESLTVSKVAKLFWNNPVVALSALTGVTGVLAEQQIVPGWVPLVVLAAVTPVQRSLVTPTRKLIRTMVRRG